MFHYRTVDKRLSGRWGVKRPKGARLGAMLDHGITLPAIALETERIKIG